MPFTFSHPAIVIPLIKSRYRLSLTALVFGSMVPDFEFYFRMKVAENIGHHWIGFFPFDVPMAILLCFIFHNYIRNNLIYHLPKWYKARFSQFIHFDWNAYAKSNKLVVFVSTTIGVLSHFLWDAFTHYDGTFVKLIPSLNNNLHVFNLTIPIYFMLQIISSVLGLFFVQKFISTLPVHTYEVGKNHLLYWLIIGLAAILILSIRFLIDSDYVSFWNVFFAVMGSSIYALIVVSFVYQRFNITHRQEQWQ